MVRHIYSFNPYSPGFSIYLMKLTAIQMNMRASILIHLDFLSIYIMRLSSGTALTSFNPYSPGFSIYLTSSCMCITIL